MFFVDTSALAKRYIHEKGSDWINKQVRDGFTVSMVAYAEVASAFVRSVRRGTLLPDQRDRFWVIFEHDMEHRFLVAGVDKTVTQQAGKLVFKYSLRGYDSIQLATALSVNQLVIKNGSLGLTFLSADQDLLKSAASEGLATENPEDH